MKTKQAFRNTVMVYFLLPAFFITFNYSIDPYGRYKALASKNVLEKLAASQNDVLITGFNYNDRLLFKNYISVVPKPGLVILGGSRILNIDADIFTPEAGRVLNAGVSGGTIRDYVGIWQVLKNQGKIPVRVLLFIDLQSVYSNLTGIGWYTLSCPFLTFEYGRINFSKYLKLILKTSHAKTSFHLESLSSLDLLEKSWGHLRSGQKIRSRLVSKKLLGPRDAAKTPSLAMIVPEPSEEDKKQSFIEHWGEENGKGESSILSNWNNFDEGAFTELSSLIEDMRANKTEVTVFMMPSMPLSYQQMQKNPKAMTNLMIFLGKVSSSCRQYGAGFYDALHEHHEDVLNTDFKDGVHLKKESIDRFLSKAAKNLKVSFIKK